MRFVDEIEITCISGQGGAGSMSFRSEKFNPRGGPDGGDGGRGGNVVLFATTRSNTLDHLRGRRVYQAEPGVPGGSNNRHGRSGEDHRLKVPVGTVVVDVKSGVELADLEHDGAEVVLCRGGRGGQRRGRPVSALRAARRVPGTRPVVVAPRHVPPLVALPPPIVGGVPRVAAAELIRRGVVVATRGEGAAHGVGQVRRRPAA